MRIVAILAAAAIAASAHADQQVAITYGEFQKEFMTVIADFARTYPAQQNELQKSALVTQRQQRFTKIKGDPRRVRDWIGVLEDMGTNGDGKAWVVIRLSPNLLTVSTWNNAFSDAQDQSLIPQSSPLFSRLAAMQKGNVVKFSGRLKRATNLTEEGRMVTPNFLFIFSDIEKIGATAL